MSDNDHAAVEALCVYCGALYDAQLQANTELRAERDRLRASLGDGPDAQAKEITRMRVEVKILKGLLEASREAGRKTQVEADGLHDQVERLTADELRFGGHYEKCSKPVADSMRAMFADNVQLTKERDQLRSEVERLKADLEYAGSAGHVANARRAAADEARADARKRICDLEDDARALEAQRDAAILDRGDAEVRCAEALEMARKLGEALEQATAVINRANAAIAAQPAPAKPQKENHHD